jgi:hypothetical protein
VESSRFSAEESDTVALLRGSPVSCRRTVPETEQESLAAGAVSAARGGVWPLAKWGREKSKAMANARFMGGVPKDKSKLSI